MIHYLIGDATVPIQKPAIIAHLCNNVGAWGAGFVLAVSRRWKAPERAYRMDGVWRLGTVQVVECEPGIQVGNLIAQDGISGWGNSRRDTCLVNWAALDDCLRQLAVAARVRAASIHMPRIGMGLAGCRDWSCVEAILKTQLKGLDVFVYDLPRSST